METTDSQSVDDALSVPPADVSVRAVDGAAETAGDGGDAVATGPQRNRVINTVAYVTTALAIAAELVIVVVNVFTRNVLGFSLLWMPEINQLLILTIAFVGGAFAYEAGFQISVTILVDRLAPRWRDACRASAEWIVVALTVLLTVYSAQMVSGRRDEVTQILSMPVPVQLIPAPIGAALICYYASRRLWNLGWRAALLGLALPAAITALLWYWLDTDFVPTSAYAILLPVAMLVLAIGVPIAVILFGMVFVYVFASGTPITSVPAQMADASTNFILLAIPFFIFAGLVMAFGGLGDRIADIVNVFVGRVKGGPLHVIVVAMYVFSGLSGSKSADMAAIGTTVGETAVRQGYTRQRVAATLGAAAIMGETIPPSIAMLVLASVSTISVASLFLAGLVPACVLAVILMAVIFLRNRSTPTAPRSEAGFFHNLGRAGVRAGPALLLPLILIGGIELGIGTPTEVSSFGVIYALAMSGPVYRQLTWARLTESARQTAGMAGMILFIVSAAGAFSWFLAIIGLPQQLAEFAGGIDNRFVFMAATIVIMMVMGAILEGLPALIILVPILLPIAQDLGINPLQYAVILILAHGIGAFTPPIGIGLYVACVVAKARLETVFRPMFGYLGILTVGIALLAAVPWFSQWLPGLFKPS